MIADRCPHRECEDAPWDGGHFSGVTDDDGYRFYSDFDDGCPWLVEEQEADAYSRQLFRPRSRETHP